MKNTEQNTEKAPLKAPLLVNRLKQDFARRQRANPALSLRGYARLLDLHPGTLSNILNGQRLPATKNVKSLLTKLELSPLEKDRIQKQLDQQRLATWIAAKTPESAATATVLDENLHYQIISEWEHFAILSLIHTKGFSSRTSWIAKRLGISELRAEYAINNLLNASLLTKTEKGALARTNEKLTTRSEINSSALRKSHKETLQIAGDKLDITPIGQRGYYSETFAIDPENIEIAKKTISEFLKKMSAILESGQQKEVYQLGVQLFPLTNSETPQGESL